MSNVLRGASNKASGKFKKGSGNGGGKLGSQPIGDNSTKRKLPRGMKELGQPDDQEQEEQNENQGGEQGLDQVGADNRRDPGNDQGGEQGGQDQVQDQEGGGDDDDGDDEPKGLLGKWNKKRKDKKALKQIKKDVKKDQLKDKALGEYTRRGVLEPNVKWAVGREPMDSPIDQANKAFKHANEEKHKTAKKISEAKSIDEADSLKKEFDKQEQEVQTKGQRLLKALMAVNIKRAFEGPYGCVKDCKAVFFNINIVALFVIGGLITMILSLCGVF